MNCDLLPISLYHKYRQEGRTPFLLDSRGPSTSISSRTILAFNPIRRLLCVDGNLIEDGEVIGNALDLFSHLEIAKGSSFFPAWLGCISYEFGKYFGLPAKSSLRGQPEAIFYYFKEGHIWENNQNARVVMPAQAGIHKVASGLDASLRWHDRACSVEEVSVPDYNDVRLEATASPQPFFNDAFAKVINSINQGDVYQVNIAKRLKFDVKKIDLFWINTIYL